MSAPADFKGLCFPPDGCTGLPSVLRDPAPREQPFRSLVQSVRDYAMILLNPKGHVETWNPGAELTTGYTAAEIVGKRLDVLYPPEARAAGLPDALLQKAARDGRVEDEGWFLRKDGTRFWADVVLSAVRDAQGRLTGYAKVTRDLTHRHHAEQQRKRREELLRSEERFRLLVEGVEEYAIFMLDPHGVVTTWNSGAERIKGYKAHEIIGKHFSLFRPESEARSGVCERELQSAARDGKFEEEGWRVRKDGSRFWASAVLTAIRDSTGQLMGFAKITRDLTQRRQLDEERLQRARAEEAVRLRDEFLLIASHELRTPLTSLQIDLHAMSQDPPGDDVKRERYLARVARNVDRLSALIDSLLNVSRLTHGKLVLDPVPLDLAAMVAQVADNMRGQAAKAGCELLLEATGPITGAWDRLRIEQVLMNLLVNAFKYGAGAPVAVSVARAGDEAIIEVKDRGPGIPEGDRERVFGRFERASSVRHYGGLGLGLYVSREIVKAHAGSIAAANRPGGGTVITVRLPLLAQLEALHGTAQE